MKKTKQSKKLKIKRQKKKNIEDLKKLILQKIQKQKTSLDKKIEQEIKIEHSFSKKQEPGLEVVASAPDFGVTRQIDTSDVQAYQRVEVINRPNIQRSLERVAFEEGATRENSDSTVYSASTDLYGARNQGSTSQYAPKGAIEGNVARDIIVDDAIRRERESSLEQDFRRYKEDSLQDNMQQENLEGRRMEEFINRKQDTTYNPNRVLEALEKDKKELEQKYKRGLIK